MKAEQAVAAFLLMGRGAYASPEEMAAGLIRRLDAEGFCVANKTMQPALDAAREAGRREGLEQAATWHDARVAAWESAAGDAFGRIVTDLNRQYAVAIRALKEKP